ncbi:MAG: EF-Tu/IF-2/RF-3 family GTPase, partial [Cyanobacteriota bacterium]|nr:EF-Tu/IF-2/RF-3 family GTPase [Cyanobacteriota bacterium]
IEKELGLACWPVNWPIGGGDRFQGVIDRRTREVVLFERAQRGRQSLEQRLPLDSPALAERVEPDLLAQALEELELLDGAGEALDLAAVHAGSLSPVFFGSAMTNFGVRPFLDAFLDLARAPTGRATSEGVVDPLRPDFSGFVFKLQANMDPRHRDRVAFVRVCSGKFEKDISVRHARSGRSIRLSRPQKLFGQDREVVEEAYPGDVIGLNNPGMFAIGDTLYVGPKVEYEGIPCFTPELFAWLRNPNPSAFKSFRKGVNELREEGAVQVLYDTDLSKRDPILAAVGQLQLEVVQYRLENEYGVQTRLEPLEFSVARWVVGGWPALESVGRLFNCKTVRDAWDRPVLLFRNSWNLQQLLEDHPALELSGVAPVVSGIEPIAL